MPIQLSSTHLRHGLDDHTFSYTLWLLLILLLLLLLILFWFLWQRFKKRNVVAASESNRLVASTTNSHADVNRPAAGTPLPGRDKPEQVNNKKKPAKAKTASTDAVKRALASSTTHTSGAAAQALQKTDDDDTFLVPDLLPTSSSNKEDEQPVRQQGFFQAPPAEPAAAEDSPRLRTSPNQPIPTLDEAAYVQHQLHTMDSLRSVSPELLPVQVQDEPPTPRAELPLGDAPADRSHLYATAAPTVLQVGTKEEQNKSGHPPSAAADASRERPLGSALPPVGEPAGTAAATREPTTILTGPSSHRSRTTHPPAHGFDRPHVGTLENVSAISLDEFWQDSKVD